MNDAQKSNGRMDLREGSLCQSSHAIWNLQTRVTPLSRVAQCSSRSEDIYTCLFQMPAARRCNMRYCHATSTRLSITENALATPENLSLKRPIFEVEIRRDIPTVVEKFHSICDTLESSSRTNVAGMRALATFLARCLNI